MALPTTLATRLLADDACPRPPTPIRTQPVKCVSFWVCVGHHFYFILLWPSFQSLIGGIEIPTQGSVGAYGLSLWLEDTVICEPSWVSSSLCKNAIDLSAENHFDKPIHTHRRSERRRDKASSPELYVAEAMLIPSVPSLVPLRYTRPPRGPKLFHGASCIPCALSRDLAIHFACAIRSEGDLANRL